MQNILILGSGPNVVQSRDWPRSSFDRVVAINNAWAVRDDWDDLIYPEDFPPQNRPTTISASQQIVTAADYVPAQNAFGGFVYAGGTMALTACYWALATLRPKVIAVMGCDMMYPAEGPTHFYGTGTADPLREDISLRNLTAKSARLEVLAGQAGCAMVNLSSDPSRLTFPRALLSHTAAQQPLRYDATAVAAALAEEQRLAYFVASGRYWEVEDQFDPDAIDALDQLWIKAGQPL